MQRNEPQERDAVDDQRAWQRALEYGEQRARAAGIRPEDVQRLIDEYRAESKCRG